MILFDLIAAAWFFMLGSVIGSFMNVVVYRTPRGKSIIGSSRCPQCDAAIRWYDNVPILGWFFLSGKCRDCGLPISPRYPVVEFVTACLFLVLAIAELSPGGANLPNYEVDAVVGFAGVIADTDWPLIRMYALQVLLLSTLFCWGLIRVDEQTIPPIQMWGMWGVALTVLFIWPDVMPMGYAGATANVPEVAGQWDGFRSAVFGFCAAGIVCFIWTGLRRLVDRAREPKAQSAAFAAAITSIGLVLGWQAVVSVLFLTALSRAVFALSNFRSPNIRNSPVLIDMLVATVIHLCFWSRLWMLPSWPGAGDGWATMLATAIALLVLAFATRAPDAGRVRG